VDLQGDLALPPCDQRRAAAAGYGHEDVALEVLVALRV